MRPGGKIAAITKGANSATGFAGEHGTDADALDAGRLNGIGQFFGNFLVDLDDDAALEVLDAFERDAANDSVTERLNFDARFDDGLDVDAVGGAAIGLVDDDVLRHVDEAAGEVAGVRGLKRSIRQTFTRTVSRDEVLQHGRGLRGSWK